MRIPGQDLSLTEQRRKFNARRKLLVGRWLLPGSGAAEAPTAIILLLKPQLSRDRPLLLSLRCQSPRSRSLEESAHVTLT